MSRATPYPADSSAWGKPVAHTKAGDSSHPAPTPLRDGRRDPSPDPYTDGNPHVMRNFSRDPSSGEGQ